MSQMSTSKKTGTHYHFPQQQMNVFNMKGRRFQRLTEEKNREPSASESALGWNSSCSSNQGFLQKSLLPTLLGSQVK